MADGKVVISTALDNSGIQKDVKALGGVVKGSLGGLTKVVAGVTASISAAFGAAAVAITKQAVDAYADYEQLIGGVETLFKGAADKVIDYAEDAFYTVGMSANEYMATVTSFSASLISSLGGDTAKAADVADMALTDMADNANKMGTALESIKTAYQGFAKQNYTMLDNLKLGYGGTKTEMERLLADAQKLTGVKYNISNLSDVYNAIHAVQKELGIAGATAEEAEKTITGSANMTKAAWKNVLAAIAGGGDLDKAINNLVYSVSRYFDNIVPVVERSLAGIGQLIAQIAPALVQTVATALIKAIPSLISAVYQMIIGLANGVYEGIVALLSGSTKEVAAQLNTTSGLADGYNDAADGASNLAEATEEAGKAAKKSLAPFDELTKLSGNDAHAESATGVIGGAASVGSGVLSGASPETEQSAASAISAIGVIRGELEKLAQWTGLDLLWADLKKGISKIDFDAIRANFERVFAGLLPIAQSAFGGIGEVSRSFCKSAGTVLGEIASIAGKGIEIATGGVARFLDAEGATISEWTSNIALTISGSFDDLTFSADAIFGTLWDSLDANQNTIEASIASLLSSLTAMKMTAGTIFSEMWSGITKGIRNWTSENERLINSAFDGIINLTTSLSDTVSEIVGGLFGTLLDWWNQDGTEIWDGVVACVGDIMSWVTALWNETLQPIIQSLINEATNLWESHLQPLWDNVLSFIASVWDAVKLLWDTILKPAVDWIIENFGPPIKNIIDNVIKWVKDFIGIIVDVVSGILKSLGGLLDFVVGVFTGDWEAAWNGIKDFFGGIWDAVWGVVKGTINLIIDGLNMLWSGLYAALRNIINGVGEVVSGLGEVLGQDWGWEIPANPPMIPRLAKGAVLPPNRPFMAVVGDQTHGTNVEAPLTTIQEAVAIVMEDMIRSNIAGHEATVAVLREILEAVLGIHIGDDVIGQAVARYTAKLAIIKGGG